MNQILKRFKTHCEANNVSLMADDMRYLDKLLKQIPEASHRSVLRRYLDEWVLGMADAPYASKAQSSGRFRANRWVDEAVNKK